MWKGNVARTERHGNTLDIIVSYSNGTNEFTDIITTDRAQTDEWLINQITDRLNQLNALDNYESTLIDNPIIIASELAIDTITGNISQIITSESTLTTPADPSQDISI